jgi:hypothetical protein
MKELFSDAAECRAIALHITSHHIGEFGGQSQATTFLSEQSFFLYQNSKIEAQIICAARRLSRRRKAVLAASRFRCKPLFWDSAVRNTTSCYFRPSRNVCMSVSRWTNFFRDEQTCRAMLKMCLITSISFLNSSHEEL